MEPGKLVRWEWEVYGVSADVTVKAVEPLRRISIEWDNPPFAVEWRFTPYTGHATMVEISSSGFRGADNEVVAQALDSMGGFSFLLAAAKALLEHNTLLTLVADHHPEAHKKQE